MQYNSQVSNWLVSVLGGLATWAVVLAIAILLLAVVARIRVAGPGNWQRLLYDRSFIIRVLALGFGIWVLAGFSSNAPKLSLDPDYTAEQAATRAQLESEAGEVESLAPEKDSAQDSSARLQQLREEQREAVLEEE
ncbi:hypothetical protein [Microbulbifer sediminum]|uniref:hypothetical protein n=1 Tax=Microbulbifer sediminum TaxID=2904250 RepID=UPI001F23AC09|nr:hypothetical protein [Microbulbifer sediminum]